MTPAELITNIKSLALVGATGSANDDTRVYNFLNMAYRTVYEKVTAKYPWAVQTTQNVVMTAGSGTMGVQPLHIIKVADSGNNYAQLDPTDIDTVEERDAGISGTGNPNKFWVEGFTTLKSYPLNDTTLRVRYTPNPATLSSSSAEADIKVPPVFHDVLTWETLKLMAYDERDKVVGAELAFNQTECDDANDRMWRHFNAKAPQEYKPVVSYLN